MTMPSTTLRPIIDVHTHLSPERFSVAVSLMDQAGLASMVNLNGGFGDDLHAAQRAAARSPGRILNFCRLNWEDIDNPAFGKREADELARSKAAGALGLKVPKTLGLRLRGNTGSLVAVDDARFDPVWEAAGALDLPVLIHTADPVDFWLPVDEKNPSYATLKARPQWSYHGSDVAPHRELLSQRDRVVARHRSTVFIYAHMGDAIEDIEYLSCELDKNPHLHLDTSARCNRMGRQDTRAVREFFLKYQDRILFGTDAGANLKSEKDLSAVAEFYRRHWVFFESDREDLAPFTRDLRITGIDLPEAVLQKVYWRNSRRLLGLE